MYNIVIDMGGVLMDHNLPGCIEALTALMGEANMASVLGLLPNGEGVPHSLMEQFENGTVDEASFVQTVLAACHPGTTAQQVVDAWTLMHGGIAAGKLDQVREWHNQGHHIILLSNSNPIHQRDIMEHYDMSSFDHCFFSHEVKAIKPDRAIYEAVERYLCAQGWDACPTIFIDDIEANRRVGESIGWKTAMDLHSALLIL